MTIVCLAELAREAHEKNTIMTLMDSETMECWHVYPNGYVEQRNMLEKPKFDGYDPAQPYWVAMARMKGWAMAAYDAAARVSR